MIIYEPFINDSKFTDIKVINSLDEFKFKCDLILANRIDENLNDVIDKVFSRDIYQEN